MIVLGLLVLAVVSGALGLGVAFAAVPFLSFFLGSLVHEVQPLSLLLNGATAMAAVAGFALAGKVQWRRALPLAALTARRRRWGRCWRSTSPSACCGRSTSPPSPTSPTGCFGRSPNVPPGRSASCSPRRWRCRSR